jgi:hypothetical protein
VPGRVHTMENQITFKTRGASNCDTGLLAFIDDVHCGSPGRIVVRSQIFSIKTSMVKLSIS